MTTNSYNNQNNNKRNHLSPYNTPVDPPSDLSLPFLTYGIFRPGDISFLMIKDFVESYDKPTIELEGNVMIRDGVKIFDFSNKDAEIVDANRIIFNNINDATKAYKIISDKEPSNLYEWKKHYKDGEAYNILIAKQINKGGISIENEHDNNKDFWTIKQSFWNNSFNYVESILKKYSNQLESSNEYLDFKTLKEGEKVVNSQSLIELQQNYIYLWSLIERFSYYRYSNNNSKERIRQLFKDFTKDFNNKEFNYLKNLNFQLLTKDGNGVIYSVESLRDNAKFEENEINFYYYYTVRNNIVHAGKTFNKDKSRVYFALAELFYLFKNRFELTKEECKKFEEYV